MIKMKVLSNTEILIKLNKILNYNIFDIKKEIKSDTNNIFTLTTCLDVDSNLNDIILDIEDINHIINNKDLLIMSSSQYRGCNAPKEAMILTVKDIEKNKQSFIKADGILVYFQVNSDYKMFELAEAMDIVCHKWCKNTISNKPNIIFGISCNNNLKDDYTKVTIFVSYLTLIQPANKISYQLT